MCGCLLRVAGCGLSVRLFWLFWLGVEFRFVCAGLITWWFGDCDYVDCGLWFAGVLWMFVCWLCVGICLFC